MSNFLKRIFHLDEKMSQQENLIYEIFTKLVDRQDTNKVLYTDGCIYLSNVEMKLEAAINGNEIIIRNGQEVLMVTCQYKFMCMLSDRVSTSVGRCVENLYDKMSENQTTALENINTKIDTCSDPMGEE